MRIVTDDPFAMLWHYCCGQLVEWVPGSDTQVHWEAATHRGVQWLHKVKYPRKQKRYIFSPLFEIRYNQSFEEVLRACADLAVELGMSESSIKRVFAKADMPLSRIDSGFGTLIRAPAFRRRS